jgi:hypothetical protein
MVLNMTLLKLWDSRRNICNHVLYSYTVCTRQCSLGMYGSLSTLVCMCVCVRAQPELREFNSFGVNCGSFGLPWLGTADDLYGWVSSTKAA